MKKSIYRVVSNLLCLLLLCLELPLSAASAQTKLVALTFDDGPSPVYTPQVLSVLDEKNVKATFFLVGKWLPGKQALVRQMAADGQQIGNHTFNHVKLTCDSAEQIRSEIDRTDQALAAITGQTDYMVRPPFGARSSAVISAIDAPVILWSIDPAAGEQVPGDQMARFVISRAKDGDIILLHDTTQYNLDAVPLIIDGLHRRGFEFVTVDELFRLKGVTPQKGVVYKNVTGTDARPCDKTTLRLNGSDDAILSLKNGRIPAGDSSPPAGPSPGRWRIPSSD